MLQLLQPNAEPPLHPSSLKACHVNLLASGEMIQACPGTHVHAQKGSRLLLKFGTALLPQGCHCHDQLHLVTLVANPRSASAVQAASALGQQFAGGISWEAYSGPQSARSFLAKHDALPA